MAVGRDALHVEAMVIKTLPLLVHRFNSCQLSKIEIEI